MAFASSVEPIKSQNRTVTWRRSASCEAIAVAAAWGGAGDATSSFLAAIAFLSFRPCPSEKPSFSRSRSSSSRSVSKSISFSARTEQYCARPRSLSHASSLTMRPDLPFKEHGAGYGAGFHDPALDPVRPCDRKYLGRGGSRSNGRLRTQQQDSAAAHASIAAMLRPDERALDNPIWSCLTTRHAHLALGGTLARRFPAAFSPIAGLPAAEPDNVAALESLVDVGDDMGIFGPFVPALPANWET